ncbi:MAG TPA: hypothetical protein VLK36_16460 [Gaiellaceae bacterium]|nr:hypothetical protein [Gaiellaceae bacterium]
MTRLAAVLAVAALLLSACGGSSAPKDDPGPFALNVVKLITHNRYEQAWADLHPDDQQVAPLHEYVTCESRSPVIAVPTKVKVVSINDESVGLGNGHFEDSKAVDVSLDFAGGFNVVHTVHLVAKNGRWKWILPGWRFREYKADRCPVDSASSPPPQSS